MRGLPVLAALLLFACQALAAPAWQELYDEGRTQFEAGQWQNAYGSFHQAFLLAPGNPEISFFLGRAAYEQGDYENAVMAFDRVLIIDPDSDRVKLELARSYMGLKAWSVARKYFNEVLDSSPPPEVVKNIQMMLDVISRAQRRHFFNGLLSFEYAIDDNVYASPASDTVRTAIGDVDLTGTGASPVDDQILNTSLALNHRYQGDGTLSWQTTGSFVNSTYIAESDLNINYAAIRTGPVQQWGPHAGELKGLASYLELDNSSYLSTWGIEGGLSLAFSSHGRIDSIVRVEEEKFHTVSGRDAIMARVGIAPALVFGPNRITLAVTGEIENADNDVYSYDRVKASLRYERKFPGDVLFSLNQTYRWSDYEEAEPLFGNTRQDDLWETRVGLAKVFWRSREGRRHLTYRLNYLYQNSNSNIDLYTYDKNLIAISLALGF